MKFSCRVIDHIGRIGTISDFVHHSNICLETPLCMLTTKGLCVPHMTHDVVQMVTQEPFIVHFPLNALAPHQEAISTSGQGLAKFASMENCITYCSIADPLQKSPSGYNDKAGVSVWTKCGRVQLNAPRHAELLHYLKADMVQALCDGDTNLKSSKKRIGKSINSTTSYLDHYLEARKTDDVLKSSVLVGALEGGYSIDQRKAHASHMSKIKELSVFSIDGLHENGPDVQNIPFATIEPVLEAVLPLLPLDKPRVLHGAWSPQVVLKCIKLGVDLFDSSLPYVCTERGAALAFQYKEVSEDSSCTEELCEGECEMNLLDKRFSIDMKRLCTDCCCYTCSKYTRSYIHYLLTVNEMQAKVLLMAHNLHHYLEFFKAIRNALKKNLWIQLEKRHS